MVDSFVKSARVKNMRCSKICDTFVLSKARNKKIMLERIKMASNESFRPGIHPTAWLSMGWTANSNVSVKAGSRFIFNKQRNCRSRRHAMA